MSKSSLLKAQNGLMHYDAWRSIVEHVFNFINRLNVVNSVLAVHKFVERNHGNAEVYDHHRTIEEWINQAMREENDISRHILIKRLLAEWAAIGLIFHVLYNALGLYSRRNYLK